MDKKWRTTVLIEGRRELAEKMLDSFKDVAYEVIHPSEIGLIMIEMRECAQQTRFYLGEVLATRATVRIGHIYGRGLVIGQEMDFALQLAVIDAVFESNLAPVEWTELLLAEEQWIKQQKQKLSLQMNQTKVNFSTMEVEE